MVVIRNLPVGRTGRSYLVLAMGCETVSHLELAKVMACTVKPQVSCAKDVRIDGSGGLPIRLPGQSADARDQMHRLSGNRSGDSGVFVRNGKPSEVSALHATATPSEKHVSAQPSVAYSEDPAGSAPGELQGNWLLLGSGTPVLARIQLIHDITAGQLSGDYYLTEHACALVGAQTNDCELSGTGGAFLQAKVSADMLLLSFNPTNDEDQRFTLSMRRTGRFFSGSLRTRGPEGIRSDVRMERAL